MEFSRKRGIFEADPRRCGKVKRTGIRKRKVWGLTRHKSVLFCREGPCLVLAGPGSGKTLTIVNRIRHLIEECKVRPEEILVITFTKYAAAEMKVRLLSYAAEKSFR